MAEENKLRADVLLCEKGLAASRERAQALISAGLVYAGGTAVKKPAQKLDADTQLEVRGEWCPYVSRGGFKLEKALKAFGIDPGGKVCIDIGASTGGFTDVLLQNGAKLVYAVDVGTDQLDPGLTADSRVVKMEQVNARTLSREQFNPAPELGVMDVSFISIRKILPALRDVLGDHGRLISLIKPQFEAGKEKVGKKGVVREKATHKEVLDSFVSLAQELGFKILGLTFSPVKGPEGNIEFLGHLSLDDVQAICPDTASIVDQAHNTLNKGAEA